MLIRNLKQVSDQRPSAAIKIVEVLLQTFERQTLERRRAHRTTLTALNRYRLAYWETRPKELRASLTRLEDQLDSISLGLTISAILTECFKRPPLTVLPLSAILS